MIPGKTLPVKPIPQASESSQQVATTQQEETPAAEGESATSPQQVLQLQSQFTPKT